jgi:hypothetical protein
MLRALTLPVLAVVFILTASCSKESYTIVPVSGRVTTKDGKPPPARLYVNFQPKGSKDNLNPGPGSVAITDQQGRFTLKIDDKRSGAVVGTHVVKISTVLKGQEEYKPSETGSPDGFVPGGREIVPAIYNDQTTLTFPVPQGGTDKADFVLDLSRGRR